MLTLRRWSLFIAVGTTVGCVQKAADDAPATPATPEKVGEIAGLKTPESARYDSARDAWFISNINGIPSDKDGNGFITRASGDRATVDTTFIAGGKNGVVLNAPKGLAISGDTLWVADIDAVRAFNTQTGATIRTIDLKPQGAVFLNDVTVAADGSLYVTDTGIRIEASGMTHPGPDRVFRIAGNAVTEVVRFAKQEGPNGITFDRTSGHFVIVPFGAASIFHWSAGAAQADSVASGVGGYDGVEILADGRVLVSSWTDSAVHVMSGNTLTPFIRGVPGPADIGVDAGRNIVAIPIFEGNRVELWTIPAR
jgi:hypothetical protein